MKYFIYSFPCLGEMIKHIGGKLRVKPEQRAQSARFLNFEVEAWIKSEARDWAGEGSGERAWGAPPQKILKIHTWNRAIWCIVQLFKQAFLSFPSGEFA